MAATDWLSNPQAGVVRTVRPGQITMARLVEEILTSEAGGIAFLEAGTGTGKSFAYLIPALLSNKRVVISTAKKTLQTQLIEKDLPFLTSKIKPTTYALLKGKNNYACMLRFKELITTDAYKQLPQYERNTIEEWIEQSAVNDLSELTPPFTLENLIRVAECVRKSCPYAENGCGYIAARDAALNAQIVVVNHALLAYDLSVGGGKILGKYDALVIDEAHQAPKYFREAVSLKLHHKHPEMLRRLFNGTEYEPHEILDHIYNTIFTKVPEKNDKLNLTPELIQVFEDLHEELDRIYDRLAAKGLLNEDDAAETTDSIIATARAKLKAGAVLIEKCRKLVKIVLGKHVIRNEEGDIIDGDETDYLCYVEKRGRGEVPEIVVTPIEIGPIIAPALIGIKRVVITSATLATANGMDYMAREYGLHASQITIKTTLPSPFDYKSRSTAYISPTAPDPSSRGDEYYAALSSEIHELLVASRGGAFVLCASYDDMNNLADGCRELLRQEPKNGTTPYIIATQTSSPESMLEWFRKTPRGALFAVKTFWEGVDQPGLGLRLVIIPRLPFPNVSDVVLRARKEAVVERLIEQGYEQGRAQIQTWEDFDLQEAIMDLKQGAGRLIRTETDMGVVALLDKRAYGNTKKYSSKVRNALPMPTTYEKNKVLRFLTMLADKVTPENTTSSTIVPIVKKRDYPNAL
jgi:ATP-dependent DNA helicase DinG